MATDSVRLIILKGVIHGLLWALLYYNLRKGWNPANYGSDRQNIELRQEAGKGSKADFYGDALYGGIASVFVYTIDKVLYRLIGI